MLCSVGLPVCFPSYVCTQSSPTFPLRLEMETRGVHHDNSERGFLKLADKTLTRNTRPIVLVQKIVSMGIERKNP